MNINYWFANSTKSLEKLKRLQKGSQALVANRTTLWLVPSNFFFWPRLVPSNDELTMYQLNSIRLRILYKYRYIFKFFSGTLNTRTLLGSKSFVAQLNLHVTSSWKLKFNFQRFFIEEFWIYRKPLHEILSLIEGFFFFQLFHFDFNTPSFIFPAWYLFF